MKPPLAVSISRRAGRRAPRPVFPFTSIVGQEEMKLALLLNVIDPVIGGVLMMGHRGTGKSTAVRALADLLPPLLRVRGCPYGCDPRGEDSLCAECAARLARGDQFERESSPVPVVDLPLGATEDRVCGSINIERALTEGVQAFDPGLLARANRGFLYIDEVNLLEDHLVDLLLDVAVTGRHIVEREGISIEHPARFVLVGSGNPEEGELRPQLLDRFGLHVEVGTETDVERRVEIILARDEFERQPVEFCSQAAREQKRLRRQLARGRERLAGVRTPREVLRRIAELCLRLRIDGHRGEIVITRAARALAAFEGRSEISDEDVRRVAVMSLRHRLRRDPLEQSSGGSRVEQALDDLFPAQASAGRGRGRREKLPEEETPPPPGANGKPASGTASRRSPSGREKGRPSPGDDLNIPAAEAALRAGLRPARGAGNFRLPVPSASSGRRAKGGKRSTNAPRGRYATSGARAHPAAAIALDATLRAVAARSCSTAEGRLPGARLKTNAAGRPHLREDDAARRTVVDPCALRYKRFTRKRGTLFIFAVDTSGSMAISRIGHAKGALARLLRRSYVNRDRVALISFREDGATAWLRPSQAASRAKRILDRLPVGGATPLAAGLLGALELARSAARQGAHDINLLLFTDGRANVPLRAGIISDRVARQRIIDEELDLIGPELRRAGIEALVVDTQDRFTSGGEARMLAARLGAGYTHLSSAASID